MKDCKWVTLAVTSEELAWLDDARKLMEGKLGLKLSRNSFVKRLLFASVPVDELEEGTDTSKHLKTI